MDSRGKGELVVVVKCWLDEYLRLGWRICGCVVMRNQIIS